jgi:hypothetical protein
MMGWLVRWAEDLLEWRGSAHIWYPSEESKDTKWTPTETRFHEKVSQQLASCPSGGEKLIVGLRLRAFGLRHTGVGSHSSQ